MYADNFIGISQNFLKPDIVNKFSSAIGETTEKTQRGIKAVLPTLLMGIVNKGQNKNGAETLVNLVNKDGLEGEKIPDYTDENYLDMGTDAVRGIFGNDLESVASNLGDSTGIQTSGIKKMMNMSAPLVMGYLGTKMKREGLSAVGLSGFLAQQKVAISNLVPENLLGRFTTTTPTSTTKTDKTFTYRGGPSVIGKNISKNNRSPMLVVTLFALAMFLGLWWFTGRRDLNNIVSPTNSVITGREESMTFVDTPVEIPIVSTINELLPFLQSGSTELPRSFRFENVNFILGTNNLMVGSEIELEKIAAAMKEFPNSKARIEGYTANTATEPENVELSKSRAAAIKDRLIEFGVAANQLEAVGMGSSKPVANNDTEEGRAQNERIEFVVTRIQ